MKISPAWARIGLLSIVVALFALPNESAAQSKGDKTFNAVMTDTQGTETDVKNIFFYWEEKISETAFVPHEVRQLPVKRGTATIQVKFDTIKQIDVKQSGEKGLPTFTITLNNGKSGDFAAALPGSFRGESDFGQTELPITTLSKIVFK